jgi:poly [ADP-ribose] polymerase
MCSPEREFEAGDNKVEGSDNNSEEEEPVPDSKLLPELQVI